MPRTLMDDIAADAATFVNEFSESVVYRPFGGTARTISALVNRFPPNQLPGVPEASLPSVVLTVRNNATTGISSTELDTGGDRLDVAIRYGETASTREIARLLKSDAGLVVIEVR